MLIKPAHPRRLTIAAGEPRKFGYTRSVLLQDYKEMDLHKNCYKPGNFVRVHKYNTAIKASRGNS